MNNQPNQALLNEYGLNTITYRLLDLARRTPLHWARHSDALKKISGNSANSLRKLVDRHLLVGPQRGEGIASKMFALTASGLDTLQCLDRGLHKPDWLSAGRVTVLRLLVEYGDLSERKLLDCGAHKMSLISLRDAGYINQLATSGTWYDLTPLGREAWLEYEKEMKS